MTPRDLLLWLLLLSTAPLAWAALRSPAALGPPVAAPDRPAVDLNRATLADLIALDGVGPRLARAIAAARPFARVEDLARVPGIGPKRLAQLRPYVALDAGR